MNEKLRVLELVSKTERVRVETADGKYHLEGSRRSNNQTVTGFDGGNIVREDGVSVAYIQSWSYDGNMTIQYNAGHDVEEISLVAKRLLDALKGDVATIEEGGAA